MQFSRLVIPTIAALVCVSLSGCYKAMHKVAFNEQELVPYSAQGNCSLSGQAFLTTQGGDVKYAAGRSITLMPDTPYNYEWFVQSIVLNSKYENHNPRANQYSRRAVADAQGNFTFTGIPAGQYIVYTKIDWTYFNGQYNQQTGGEAAAFVSLTPGANEKVIVNRSWLELIEERPDRKL